MIPTRNNLSQNIGGRMRRRKWSLVRARTHGQHEAIEEDTLELQLKAEEGVAGQNNGPGTSRKRRKAIHEQDGSEGQSSVLKPSLGTAVVSTQITSTATTNSRPRQQPKRSSRRTPAVGSRDERLKTLRPRTRVNELKTPPFHKVISCREKLSKGSGVGWWSASPYSAVVR
jgi:hypothetical protein